MNTRRKIWALGCGCVGMILTGAVIWTAIEIWAIYKSEMIWLVSVHRVKFMMANGRLPFDGREMNIWFGRGIGNGDRLPPVDFEGGIFNCGNRDQKSLDNMTRLRVSMVESAVSFSSRLELMGIDGKCRLQALIAGFKSERNPFDVRYDMLRQIGVYLVLSSNDDGGDVEAGERQAALNLLWDVGKDETSPFCGIALYGLARNVDASERKEFQGLLNKIAKSDMSRSICRAAALYLLTEPNGRRCPVGCPWGQTPWMPYPESPDESDDKN